MPQSIFVPIFLVVWVCALIYVACVWRLGQAIRRMKAAGRGHEAPDILFDVRGMVGAVWLITGRYAKLEDADVVRWAKRARLLFFVVVPMMLIVVALAATLVSNPTA